MIKVLMVCVFVGIFLFFLNIFETKNKWFVLNFNEEKKRVKSKNEVKKSSKALTLLVLIVSKWGNILFCKSLEVDVILFVTWEEK